jgi:RNA polymerase sigma factor (sigma-70 family)
MIAAMSAGHGTTIANRTDPTMRHRLLTACRPSASDAVLARRAGAGDDDAFEKLYIRYQPRLEAYCRSIVRHDEDARDAVQNAMTKALVALRRDHPANVQGWLFRIAHNEAISLLRRRRPTTELVDVMHDVRPGPAGDLLMREELRATLDGVRALPHNLQHPLLLRELAGLSYGQVAEVVGGTPAAARKAVFDARTALSADRAGRDEACSVIRQSLSEGDGRRRRARVVRSHLQSCQSCCAWESEQRQRRYHLASLLPAASAAGTAGGWLSGLFGGGSTVAAGVTGSLATNAKVAASLAVIAAGAGPVVERVEREASPTKVRASAAPAATTAQAARRTVAAATATRAAAQAARRAVTATTATRAAAQAAQAARRPVAAATATRAAAQAAIGGTSRPTTRAASSQTSAGRDSDASQRGAAARRGTGDGAAGPRTNDDGAAALAAAGDATGRRRAREADQPRPMGDSAVGAGQPRRLGDGAVTADQPRRPAAGAAAAPASRPVGGSVLAADPSRRVGESAVAAVQPRRVWGRAATAAQPRRVGGGAADEPRRVGGRAAAAAQPRRAGGSDPASRDGATSGHRQRFAGSGDGSGETTPTAFTTKPRGGSGARPGPGDGLAGAADAG